MTKKNIKLVTKDGEEIIFSESDNPYSDLGKPFDGGMLKNFIKEPTEISFSNKSKTKPLSKWSQEVVSLLKEHGEKKNQEIIIALRKIALPPSYHHVSQIFKSKSDRKFYYEELVNNGSYFSLKTPK